MPIAYVTEPGAKIRKQGRTLIVEKDSQVIAEWELIHLDTMVFWGNVHISTPALKVLLREGVEVAFLSSRGRIIGQLTPPKPGNIHIRIKQYQFVSNPGFRLQNSRKTVSRKISSMIDLLERYRDNYSDLSNKQARVKLKRSISTVEQANSLEQLRGVEGNAASIYWKAFRSLNRSQLEFSGRSKRPPRDPVNALLSLGYVFLTNELWGLLDAIGFDPFIGYYHDLKPNRPSLALDLIEPFRHQIIDRLVLRLINLGQIKRQDFTGDEPGGFRLDRSAWHVFIRGYEQMMQSSVKKTSEQKRCTLREVLQFHCQQYRDLLSKAGNSEQTSQQPAFSGDELDETR